MLPVPTKNSDDEAVMDEREPVCRAHRRFGMMRAAPVPIGCAGATWRRCHFVRNDLTAEPPAHCRLVSSHDLFLKTVAFRLYRSKFVSRASAAGERRPILLKSFALERQQTTFASEPTADLDARRPRRSTSAAGRREAVALRGAESGR